MMAEPRMISVRFTRDQSKDVVKDGITYSGFALAWPDGRPLQTGLEKFCQQGIKLFFGKQGITQDSVLLHIFCFSVEENDPITRHPLTKTRRFYLLREGNLGIIYFMQGIITDVVFDLSRDEPEVLTWIGFTSDVKDGEKHWIDVYALPE